MKKLIWTIFCFTPIIANVVTCQVPETLTKACLYLEQGNWQEAWRATSMIQGKLGKKETCSGDPVARLLHGHTALAAGKYDEAMNQFYCDCDSLNAESLTKWQAFCQELVSRNPTHSSAHYLLGDALARLEKYEGATQEFTRAIELSTSNFLARNARGVNEWIVSKTKGESMCLRCTGDWDTTLMLKPDMADAFVNKGVSFFLVGGDQESCIILFKKATDQKQDYSLAHNGIKVAYHAQGNVEGFFDNIPLSKSTPFSVLDSKGNDLDVAGARGITAVLKVALPPAIKGGVYSIQLEGINKKTSTEGLPTISGTWFLLNYPSKNWKI